MPFLSPQVHVCGIYLSVSLSLCLCLCDLFLCLYVHVCSRAMCTSAVDDRMCFLTRRSTAPSSGKSIISQAILSLYLLSLFLFSHCLSDFSRTRPILAPVYSLYFRSLKEAIANGVYDMEKVKELLSRISASVEVRAFLCVASLLFCPIPTLFCMRRHALLCICRLTSAADARKPLCLSRFHCRIQPLPGPVLHSFPPCHSLCSLSEPHVLLSVFC